MKNLKTLITKLLTGEAMRYLIIGVCTTLVNFVIFTVMTKGFGMDATPLGVTISNCVSIPASIVFAYVANKLVVFRSHCKSMGELMAEIVKFFGARALTMVLEFVGVELLVNRWGMDSVLGKLAMQVFVIVANYFISKFLVFTGKKK